MNDRSETRRRPSAPPRRPAARSRRRETPRPPRRDTIPTTLREQVLRSLAAIGIPHIVVVLAIAVIVFAVLLFGQDSLALIGLLTARTWLVFHLAPLTIDGVTVGLLPLVPPVLLVALIARRVRRALGRRVPPRFAGIMCGVTVLVPVTLTVLAAMIAQSAHLAAALGSTVLIHFAAFVVGVPVGLWRRFAQVAGVPGWVVDAARDAVRFLVALSVTGLVLWGVCVIVGWDRQVDVARLYTQGPGGFGWVLVLTLLYLPNTALAAGAVLLGGEAHVGAASISLFSVHLTALPPTPVFAALPPAAAPWAPVAFVLLVPVAAAVWRSYAPGWRQAVGAGLIAGCAGGASWWLAGGELGVFGSVGPQWLIAAGLAAVWVAGLGIVVTAAELAVRRRRPPVTLEGCTRVV